VRYLRAEGRDVLVEEDKLEFDPMSRTLSLSGDGSRKKASAARKHDGLVTAVVNVVQMSPGINGTEVGRKLTELGVGHQKGIERQALATAVLKGLLVVEAGSQVAKNYHLPRGTPTSPDGARPTYPDPTLIGGVRGRGRSDAHLPRPRTEEEPAAICRVCCRVLDPVLTDNGLDAHLDCLDQPA
jgi:hypothetical protein